MNPPNFSFIIKRTLLRIIFVSSLTSYPSLVNFSNPIIPPSVVLEIYFSPWSWVLEIMNNEYYAQFENLDSLWLVGQFDTAQFEPGHSFLPGQLRTVSNYNMLTSMTIEQDGDAVYLCQKYQGSFEPLGGISWGNFSSEVTAPEGEQSIAIQRFTLPENDWAEWTAKELPHTIYSNPGQVMKKATFSGYVMDKNDQPMEDIYLDYCYNSIYYYGTNPTVPLVYTNSEGYFQTDDMYCRRYNVKFRIGDFYGPIIGYTNINLEPDSVNYYVFKLDTLLTSIHEIHSGPFQYSISLNPNPSSSRVTFTIETNLPKSDQQGVIIIYSENGFIVEIIPVKINNERQEIIYNLNDKSFASGIYLYNLEIGNRKVASGKMIIQ